MKTFKTITRDSEVIDKVTCDLCGVICYGGYDWDTKDSNAYSIEQTTIEYRKGTSYPECRFGETTTIDICPKCFIEKLIPWMKSQGCEPTITEWE